jgi:hypothetical protein
MGSTIFIIDEYADGNRLISALEGINGVGEKEWRAEGRAQIGSNCKTDSHMGDVCPNTAHASIQNEAKQSGWKLMVLHINNRCWKTPINALANMCFLLVSGGTDEAALSDDQKNRCYRCPFPWEPHRYSKNTWSLFLRLLGSPEELKPDEMMRSILFRACCALVIPEILTAAIQNVYWTSLPARIQRASETTKSGEKPDNSIIDLATSILKDKLQYRGIHSGIRFCDVVEYCDETKRVTWPQINGTEKSIDDYKYQTELTEVEAANLPDLINWAYRFEIYLRRLRTAFMEGSFSGLGTKNN